MRLKVGKSKKTILTNVRKLLDEGYKSRQAFAIAYAVARRKANTTHTYTKMDNLPKQLYIVRFVLKSGTQFDVITELTKLEITQKLSEPNEVANFVTIPGLNVAKQWPVDLVINPEQIDAFFHGPHEQWLASRKIVGVTS